MLDENNVMQENKNVKKEQNGSSNIIQNAFWFSGGFIMWVALIVFLVIVFGFIFISYINYLYPIGKVLNDDSFDITLIAMRYTFYQVILIFVPLVFFKSICPNDFIAKNKVNIILLIALILYGLFMTTLNKGWVLKINVFLSDFKKTKHYIKVLDKYETRKTHNLLTFDRAYYITFYSWKNNKISNYEIPSFQYKL